MSTRVFLAVVVDVCWCPNSQQTSGDGFIPVPALRIGNELPAARLTFLRNHYLMRTRGPRAHI